jgi:hypothetical protein
MEVEKVQSYQVAGHMGPSIEQSDNSEWCWSVLDFRRLEGVFYLATLVILAQRPFCSVEAWQY